jgi:hypothetical protein
MAIYDKQTKPVHVQVMEWGNNISNVEHLLGPGVIYFENGRLEIMTSTGRLYVPTGYNIVATPFTPYVAYVAPVEADPEADPPVEAVEEVLEVLWKPGVFIEVVSDAQLAAKYEDIPEEP